MHASVTLGRVAGVEIGINWSWLIVVALILWSLAAAVFPEENPGLSDGAYAAMAAVATLLFFASLLLHELGHAVVARREGMEIEGITLWLFGGVARFAGMFPSAGAEFRIAIAGPLVSLALGAALVAIGVLVPLPAAVDGVVVWLGRINLTLLAFNMLPALPLDGGRVLRSLVWRSTGDFTRATRIAGAVGRAFGLALIWGGIALALLAGAPGGLWLALIGWFVNAAAAAETSLATMQQLLKGFQVADAMAREPVAVPADTSLEDFVERVFPATRHAAYPVTSNGAVVGLLPFRSVAAVPPSEWPTTPVRESMLPLEETLVLSPDGELGPAAMELVQDSLGRALVLDGVRLAGLLSVTDVSRLLELRRMHESRA
jgi:Zn-dependent protease/CBS domain-containing protein